MGTLSDLAVMSISPNGEPELRLERVCEEQHPLLGKDDLGNKEPHARRGRQLPWPQQVQSLFVVVPGMQHRGQGGPRPPDRVRGGSGRILQQRDGKKKVERAAGTSLYSSTAWWL